MMLNADSLKGAWAKWMADPTLNHSMRCRRIRYDDEERGLGACVGLFTSMKWLRTCAHVGVWDGQKQFPWTLAGVSRLVASGRHRPAKPRSNMRQAQASIGTRAAVKMTRAVCWLVHRMPHSTLPTLICQGAQARVVLAHTIPDDWSRSCLDLS